MKKMGVLLMVAMLCILSFGGCQKKVTAEDIMTKVQENIKDAKSMSANVVMNMTMSYDMSEYVESEEDSMMSMSILMDMDMDITADPLAMYMEIAMKMEEEDYNESASYEIYGVPGESDDEFLLYTGMDGEWYVETADISEYMDMGEQLSMTASLAESEDVSYELQEETTQVNGREAYVLKGTIRGETLQSFLSSMESLEEVLGTDMDLSSAEASMVYTVYKDDFMPATMELDLSSFMSGLMSDMGITFDEVVMTYTFKSFDEVEEITVPEDVINQAESYDDIVWDDSSEEDVLLDTADTSVEMAEATVDAPVGIGEWGSTYTLLEDGSYFEIGVQVTSVERGDAAQKAVDAINEAYGEEILEGLNENLEYCLVSYEVYVPTDYPDETFYGVELYLTDTEGYYFDSESMGYEYNDMYWVTVVDDSELYVGPGETGKGIGIFSMEKDCTEYMFEIGDSWFNEMYVSIQE